MEVCARLSLFREKRPFRACCSYVFLPFFACQLFLSTFLGRGRGSFQDNFILYLPHAHTMFHFTLLSSGFNCTSVDISFGRLRSINCSIAKWSNPGTCSWLMPVAYYMHCTWAHLIYNQRSENTRSRDICFILATFLAVEEKKKKKTDAVGHHHSLTYLYSLGQASFNLSWALR